MIPPLEKLRRCELGCFGFGQCKANMHGVPSRCPAASAPQAVRRPLTEEEALNLFYRAQDKHQNTDMVSFLRGVEAAEAAHGIVPLAPQDKE